MKKQIISTLKVIVLASVLSSGLSYVYAWTTPSAIPPTGNVSAPLNTSGDAQVKTGTLTVGSLISGAVTATGLNLGSGSISTTGAISGGSIVSSGATTVGNLTSNADMVVNGINVGRGGGNALNNTTVGFGALQKNTTGNYNVANGYASLYSNTTGNYNVANGYASLYSNTTGGGNIANGLRALGLNTTGYSNTANGHFSLYANTTGTFNTAIGAYTLYSGIANGNSNTATGYSSLNNNSGSDNTATGMSSLSYNSGNSNTAVGVSSLAYNTGNSNTAMGRGAMYSADGLPNGNDNTAVGYYSLFNNAGTGNTAIGHNSLLSNTSGTYNTAIGFGANTASGALTNATAIGNGAQVNASNKIILGNASAQAIGGYGNWINYSDARLKENIQYKSDLGLSFITDLKTASFNYKMDVNKVRRDGLIAQDVQATLAKLGLKWSGLVIDNDEQKTLNISYDGLTIPLINSIKELKAENDKLKADNEALRAEIKTNNDALVARIEKLESGR